MTYPERYSRSGTITFNTFWRGERTQLGWWSTKKAGPLLLKDSPSIECLIAFPPFHCSLSLSRPAGRFVGPLAASPLVQHWPLPTQMRNEAVRRKPTASQSPMYPVSVCWALEGSLVGSVSRKIPRPPTVSSRWRRRPAPKPCLTFLFLLTGEYIWRSSIAYGSREERSWRSSRTSEG